MFQILGTDELDNLPRNFNQNKHILLDISGTKYDLISIVANNLGWTILDKFNQYHQIKWYDYYINEEELRKMFPFQKINHFPASSNLGKKNHLAKHLQKISKMFPQEYQFFPQTWILPYQYSDLISNMENKNQQNKLFIAKPEASSQGKGIFLFKKIEDIQNNEKMIVQRYIHNPYLIDGLKFDLRLYVLIKSIDPLKIFLFRDGLARFATQQFKKPTTNNIQNDFMHLTNYAINKKNPKFQQNQQQEEKETGHKRSFSSVLKLLQSQNKDTDILMQDIKDLIFKTIASVQPIMGHAYKSSRPKDETLELCFEILGFDIIIDQEMKPWLLEVNHTPSFQTDSNLDYVIKKNLITDTLILLNLKKKDKKLYQELKNQLQNSQLSQQIQIQCNRQKDQVIQYENQNLNGFLRVYPNFDESDKKNEMFIEGAKQIWNYWAGPRCISSIIHTQKVEPKQVQQKLIVKPEQKKIIKKKIIRNFTLNNFDIQQSEYQPKFMMMRSNSNKNNAVIENNQILKVPQEKELRSVQNRNQVQNILFQNEPIKEKKAKSFQMNIKKRSVSNLQINNNNVYSLYDKYLENLKIKQQANKQLIQNLPSQVKTYISSNVGLLKCDFLRQRKLNNFQVQGLKLKNDLNYKIQQNE